MSSLPLPTKHPSLSSVTELILFGKVSGGGGTTPRNSGPGAESLAYKGCSLTPQALNEFPLVYLPICFWRLLDQILFEVVLIFQGQLLIIVRFRKPFICLVIFNGIT